VSIYTKTKLAINLKTFHGECVPHLPKKKQKQKKKNKNKIFDLATQATGVQLETTFLRTENLTHPSV
jgi:hypothetical protein